jgi:hypothetical protein
MYFLIISVCLCFSGLRKTRMCLPTLTSGIGGKGNRAGEFF